MKKRVNLRITSTNYSETLQPSGEAYVRELEQEDFLEIQTEGMMYESSNARYITYEESKEAGLEDARTLYKLSDGQLRIRRYEKDNNGTDMDMTLQPGILNITKIQTPFMTYASLEVYTNKLEDNLDEDGYGEIEVDYRIKFDNLFSRRNILRIEVTS